MSYGAVANLELYAAAARFWERVPTDVKQAALDAAQGMVNSYLRAQFTLPLTQWGKDVERAEAVIAGYDLLVVRGYNPEAGNDDNFRVRRDQTIEWLQAVSRGDIVPDVTDSSPGAGPDGATGEGPMVATASQRGYSTRGRPTPTDSVFGGGGGNFEGD